MTPTVTDHLIAITNHLMRMHWELTREQAFLEALIAYRRYGLRLEDLPARREGGA